MPRGDASPIRLIRRHPFLTVVAAAGLLLLAATAARLVAREGERTRMGRGGDVPVKVERARLETLVDEIEALGTAGANESITVTARVTETVRRVSFEDGDLVEAGAVLVELTDAEETAQLAEARSNLVDARNHHERIRDLEAQGTAPVSQLDAAQARLAAAQARLDATLARLDDRLIRAPFRGLLGFRRVSPGTLVVPNTEITTLDDVGTIKLDFSVPERFLAGLRIGLDVRARSVAFPGREFAGRVKAINSRVDPVTRSVTVRALIPNEDLSLRPGMLLTVRLVQSRDVVLVVAEEALLQLRDLQYVYTVNGSSEAQQAAVRIGRRRPGLVEILEGLEPGQLVVIRGSDRLQPGAKVRILGAEPEASDAGAPEPATRAPGAESTSVDGTPAARGVRP